MPARIPLDRVRAALAGQYTIKREIGAGGMATVYLAEDLKHHRQVAIKVLDPDLAFAVGPGRFLREIDIAAGLTHPHILPVHDSGQADGLLFYVMPYVEGESLRVRLEREKLLPIGDAIRIAREIADALSFAHDQGLLHRDVKPENVLLEAGHAVLADFGIAKAVAEMGDEGLTATGTSLGTPVYMSPEQATGESILDRRSDLYSLGCVLYEMLAGEPPYTGPSHQAVLVKKITEPLPGLRNLRDTVPDEVERVVHRALARLPVDRYGTAEELGAALKGVALEVETGGATRLPSRRRRGRSMVAAVVPFVGQTWRTLPPRYKLARVAILAPIIAASTWWALLLRPDTALAFTEGDWILVADFENATEDPLFDHGLDTAFGISLQQSPHFNLFPRRRTQATLRRMELDPASPITEAIGQEIAEREGISVVVVPSITGVGGQYALGLSIQDPVTGKVLRSELIRVDGKDAVIDGVDELAGRVRTYLGESPVTLSRYRKQLASVTTQSLEALKQYSVATESLRSLNWDEARQGFRRALEIDSTFTAARASLGILEFERFDPESGKSHLSRAVDEVDGLTEIEGYGIRGFYADAVEQDLEKAAGYHTALSELYPTNATAHNNLGWVRSRQLRYDEALDEYKAALRLDPTLGPSYLGLNFIQLYRIGQVDSGLVWAQRRIEADEEFAMAWDHLGWAYLGMDSVEAAIPAFEKAIELEPELALDIYRVAHAHRLAGRHAEAASYLTRALEVDSTNLQTHYQLGAVYQAMGDETLASEHLGIYQDHLERSIELNPDYFYNYIELGLVLTRMGDAAGGDEQGRRAARLDSASVDAHFGLAQLAAVQGKTEEALGHIRAAIQAGFRNYIWLKVHPDFETLGQDPAFRDLLDRHMNR